MCARKLCEHHISSELHPVLVTDVFGFLDVLIRFWSQRSKLQQAEP